MPDTLGEHGGLMLELTMFLTLTLIGSASEIHFPLPALPSARPKSPGHSVSVSEKAGLEFLVDAGVARLW